MLFRSINYHIGRDQYRLVPEAITPDNVGVMMQLMIAFASMRTIGALDIAGYIDEHGLWPCFEKVVD